MSDLIERQAAIEAVEYITSSMSVCVNTDECHGMKRMQRQAVIELTNLPSAQQWIPVSERLPEAATDVLVCNDDQKQAVAIMQTQDFYGHTMKEWNIKYCLYDWDVWDEDADGKIVAWMPLPEPWKGEQL